MDTTSPWGKEWERRAPNNRGFRGVRSEPSASIVKNGAFTLTRAGYELLGCPDYVVIYANPTTGQFRVTPGGQGDWKVTDQGRKVKFGGPTVVKGMKNYTGTYEVNLEETCDIKYLSITRNR